MKNKTGEISDFFHAAILDGMPGDISDGTTWEIKKKWWFDFVFNFKHISGKKTLWKNFWWWLNKFLKFWKVTGYKLIQAEISEEIFSRTTVDITRSTFKKISREISENPRSILTGISGWISVQLPGETTRQTVGEITRQV